MNKTRNIWHSLNEVPDFKRGEDGVLKIMLTDGQEIHQMWRCTEENFKYMHLYWYGVKAWAYYSDLLPSKQELPDEVICAYNFVDDSEKIHQWLFRDSLRLIGTSNFKWQDEYTDEDRFSITLERSCDRQGKVCIKITYSNNTVEMCSIDGDPCGFVRQFVEKRHIRVIPPTIKKED